MDNKDTPRKFRWAPSSMRYNGEHELGDTTGTSQIISFNLFPNGNCNNRECGIDETSIFGSKSRRVHTTMIYRDFDDKLCQTSAVLCRWRCLQMSLSLLVVTTAAGRQPKDTHLSTF